jgi:signal transduction histidine kinase
LNPIGNTGLTIFAVHFWVSKREESSKRLMEVFERQKKAERGKDEFLANLSHEIRTPINTISGMCEILLQEKDPDCIKDDLYAIQMGSRNLMNVVRDILDFSELQSGKIELVEDAYDVTSVINDIVRLAVAQKAEKDIEIIVDIDSKIPRRLLGDEKRIRRLIMNIVDNAIKFTNEGGVYIQFGARKEEYGINLLVTVRDTGIGMNQKTIEKLFTVYNQADSSAHRQEGGIGLGLAISQKIAHQMGGVITVKSKPGEGTLMCVAVPQKIIDEQPMIQLEAEISQVIAYLDMEQYNSRIRDSYVELVGHICDEIPGKATVCRLEFFCTNHPAFGCGLQLR